jgi:hypothetical protein
MQPGSTAKTVTGTLALVGMLILSSPGVRVAQAGDGDASSPDSSPVEVSGADAGGTCKVGDDPKPRVDRSVLSARIAERLRAEMQSGGEKPVALNGRGYNYRTARDPLRELAIVEAEAKRQGEEAAASR